MGDVEAHVHLDGLAQVVDGYIGLAPRLEEPAGIEEVDGRAGIDLGEEDVLLEAIPRTG